MVASVLLAVIELGSVTDTIKICFLWLVVAGRSP